MKKVLIFLLFTFFIFSCTRHKVEETRDQGYIEYDITYLENKLEKVSLSFMPKTMVLKFNKKYSQNTIDGFMGLISIRNISNIEKNQTTTLLKFLDNKYSYLAKNNEDACCYEMMEKLQIDFLEETKEIANYTCNKAIVTYPASGTSFPIYYTKNINVKNPNQSNPYNSVDGVLLDFQLKLRGLTMNLTAKKVEFTEISNKEFIIPKDYKYISRSKMAEILDRILE